MKVKKIILPIYEEVECKESNEEEVWICEVCGHIHYGPKALEVCPVCKHPQEYQSRLIEPK